MCERTMWAPERDSHFAGTGTMGLLATMATTRPNFHLPHFHPKYSSVPKNARLVRPSLSVLRALTSSGSPGRRMRPKHRPRFHRCKWFDFPSVRNFPELQLIESDGCCCDQVRVLEKAGRLFHDGVCCGIGEVCLSGAGIGDGVHSALHLHYGRLPISFGAAHPVDERHSDRLLCQRYPHRGVGVV